MNDKYEDIIDLPHHESNTHPRMSKYNRAAQFAPFSALTGYEEQLKETTRLTDKRIELDDSSKEMIGNELNEINKIIKDRPEIEVTYFVSDKNKNGGQYVVEKGNVKRIDFVNRFIKFTDNKKIIIDDIIHIKSDIEEIRFKVCS